VILATHNMEEAEILCTRVCIIHKSQIKCIGGPQELQSRVKKGYKIEFLVNCNKQEEAQAFIQDLLPTAKILNSSAGYMVFQIFKYRQNALSKLLETIEHQKDSCGIVHWGISPSNLTDIFLSISKEEKI